VPGLPKNPRFIRDQKFEGLRQSIREDPNFFELREVIAYDFGGIFVIIGGEMRTRGAKAEGIKELPCKILPESTSVEYLKSVTIKDNAHYGEWDQDSLANDWEAGELKEWGVDEASWGEGDNSLNSEKAEEDDYNVPEIETIKTDIVLGDLFEIGEHRLLCGDSTDKKSFERLMGGSLAGIVFTDPDFSMDYDLVKKCYLNLLEHSQGAVFIACGDKQAVQLASNDFENFSKFFVQDFRQATLVANNQPMTRHVMICQFRKRPMNNLFDGFSTLLQIATDRTSEIHKTLPMSKKIELPAQFISHFSEKDDIVLDCFLHSASTMVATDQLGRKCFGIEIEPKYCHMAIDRMVKYRPEIKVTRNGKEYRQESL